MGSYVGRVLILVLAAVPARLATAQDSMRVTIANHYVAYVNLGIGTGMRWGVDSLDGTLTRQSDGSWEGEVTATVKFAQHMEALGLLLCGSKKKPGGGVAAASYTGSQRLTLTGKPVSGFNPLSQTITYLTGTADGGFLVVSVKPAAQPRMSRTECIDMYQGDNQATPLLPLNDARWIQGPGYVIGVPQSGVLEYRDGTVNSMPVTGNPDLPFHADAWWNIRITRR